MRRFPLLLLAVVFCVPELTHAQAPVKWRLQGKFYAELTVSQQRSQKVQGAGSADVTKDFTLLLVVQPKPPQPDGLRVIDLKIESAKSSSPGKLKSPDEIFFKALEGADLKLTLGTDFSVQQIEGLEEVVKKMAGPQAAQLPAAVRESLQEMFKGLMGFLVGEVFVPLPQKGARKGDTWEQKTGIALPLVGALQLQKKLTHEGKGRLPYQNLERVTGTGTFSFSPSKGDGKNPGIQVLKADIKSGEYKSTLHFDASAGRLAHGEVKIKTDLAVSMVVNKKKAQAQGLQEETLTIRTFDEKPK